MPTGFWELDAYAVLALKLEPTGLQLTRFVNALLQVEAAFSGVPAAEVRLNLKINKPDGGVDSAVAVAIPHDSTGRMGQPTVWQYKSSKSSPSDLRNEINKEVAKDLVAKGYAYRLCICDELTEAERTGQEKILAEESLLINPSAPTPKILTASDLAYWASNFLGVVRTYGHRGFPSTYLDLETWQAAAIGSTKTYVPIQKWKTTQDDLKRHLDFTSTPPEIIFFLGGEAGVGKTRLAYETLAAIEGSTGLVIYANEDQNECAKYLASQAGKRAILIADECDATERYAIKTTLAGCKDRVRVVAINSETPAAGAAPSYFLQHLTGEDVESVLAENFPEVPSEARHAYAELSAGFVRMASALCERHGEITQAGHLGPVMQTVDEYYHKCLAEEERVVIEALALVRRAGFKDDRDVELTALCSLCNLVVAKTREIAARVHDTPGFVGIGGRYFYVTPEIIARLAFAQAWKRWAALDPAGFLSHLPGLLLDQFLQRVNLSAAPEVRSLVGQFFRKWALELEPSSLKEDADANFLCVLVETDPENYLPLLRNLIETTSRGQLIEMKGGWLGGWGPRRQVVWLLERLARFPEYFNDSESMLFRLAIAESEPDIGNNATAIWRQLFRIVLSGTSLPFPQRLASLKKRILSSDEAESSLALNALEGILNPFASRMGGPVVVSGRIPPEEWSPRGNEAALSFAQALDVLRELTHSEVMRLRERAVQITIENLYNLITHGYLQQLKTILDSQILTDETRARVAGAIDHALYLQIDFAPTGYRVPPEYLAEVKTWHDSIKASDLHGRILTAVSGEPWRFSGVREQEWRAELRELADALFSNSDQLEREIGWLFSEKAKSAADLGEQIGRIDQNGRLMDKIVALTIRFQNTAFARGYVFGLLTHGGTDINRLNELLDQVEEHDAQKAYELAVAGGVSTEAGRRVIRLVDSGKLTVRHFRVLALTAGGTLLSQEEVGLIGERLVKRAVAGDMESAEIVLDLVAYRVLKGSHGDSSSRIDEKSIDLAWRAVEATARNAGRETHSWRKILESLMPYDLSRAAKIAAAALLGENPRQEEEAGAILERIASQDPSLAMDALGSAMMDGNLGWRFYAGKYDFIRNLPPGALMGWVDAHGVEAARLLARHVPPPYLGENNCPVVPVLTEYILRKFEDDDRVFHEFVAGVHSFQGYMGDIAGQHEREAEVAKKFLNHPLRRIREWASLEIKDAKAQAEYWRQRDAELRTE